MTFKEHLKENWMQFCPVLLSPIGIACGILFRRNPILFGSLIAGLFLFVGYLCFIFYRQEKRRSMSFLLRQACGKANMNYPTQIA